MCLYYLTPPPPSDETLTTQLAEARSALDEYEQNNLDLQQQVMNGLY